MDRGGTAAGGSTMGKDITAIFGTKRHGLKLGKSFSRDKEKRTAFHSVRYDFKPASIDHSKEALLEVGAKGEVNITLPNDQTKGISCTKFKGSKRPYQKECVLIYDHTTREFTLERLSNNIQVKKQRQENVSRPQLTNRPRSTLDPSSAIPSKTSPNRTSAGNKKDASLSSLPDLEQSQQDVSPLQPSPTPQDNADGSSSSDSYITDSSSDDSSSSDEEDGKPAEKKPDSDEEQTTKKVPKGSTSPGVRKSPIKKPQLEKLKTHQKPPSPCVISQLSADLQLSESSDSD